MNIEGLSEATLEKFIINGYVKDFTDIFHLDRYEAEIKTMEGFGEKSYENLRKRIENARKTTLPRLIYSLGIPNIGISNAKTDLSCAGRRSKTGHPGDGRRIKRDIGCGRSDSRYICRIF